MTAKQKRRLTVGVTDLDDLAVGWVLSGATGAADENVRAHQLVGIAGDAHASVYQDHDVLADALDVGEDVRREDHARAVFGHDAHELLEQLEASDRIEVRDCSSRSSTSGRLPSASVSATWARCPVESDRTGPSSGR